MVHIFCFWADFNSEFAWARHFGLARDPPPQPISTAAQHYTSSSPSPPPPRTTMTLLLLFQPSPETNTMASLFKQLSDDMEMIARVVEEGTKFMMGESAQMGEQGIEAGSSSSAEEPATTIGDDAHFDDEDAVYDGDMDALGDAYGSPLLGMADSVMSDIMSSQVCYYFDT
jgi:hypothetical protein